MGTQNNMRIFNTVQELWSYCTFCPQCKEHSRTITMQVGPDDRFKLDKITPYEKIGSELKILTSFQMERGSMDFVKGQCTATYVINCDDNTFQLQTGENVLAPKARAAYFYFYLYAKCGKCESYLNTMDVEFNISNNSVFNFQVDRESYYLLAERSGYHTTTSHDQNMVMVSRLEITDDGIVIDHDKVLELPFFNLDVSDVSKAINKIKMLILFS